MFCPVKIIIECALSLGRWHPASCDTEKELGVMLWAGPLSRTLSDPAAVFRVRKKGWFYVSDNLEKMTQQKGSQI